MTELEQLHRGEQLVVSGDRKAAASAFCDLWRSAAHQGIKLDAGVALLSLLNQADNHTELLQLAKDVESLAATYDQKPAIAYAQGMRALCLLEELPSLFHHQQNIVLPREWFGFATEAERKEHETVVGEIRRIQEEAKELFDRAMENAVDDLNAAARIKLFQAQGNAAVTNSFDLTHMRAPSLLGLLQVIGCERWFLFTGEARRERRRLHRAMYKSYNEAVEAHLKAGDEVGAGYVHYAIALERRTQFQFFRARLTLRKAEMIATRHRDAMLLSQIKTLKERIALKNKDMPRGHVDHLT